MSEWNDYWRYNNKENTWEIKRIPFIKNKTSEKSKKLLNKKQKIIVAG